MSGLLQETRGTVRLLRFDNPARRNALSPALRMESVSYTHLTLPTILRV